MARKARVEFEGAVYHVLDRGDRREAIFRDDTDRRRFLATLRRGVRSHRLARPCAGADEQPLTSAAGDAATDLLVGMNRFSGTIHRLNRASRAFLPWEGVESILRSREIQPASCSSDRSDFPAARGCRAAFCRG